MDRADPSDTSLRKLGGRTSKELREGKTGFSRGGPETNDGDVNRSVYTSSLSLFGPSMSPSRICSRLYLIVGQGRENSKSDGKRIID